MENFYNFTVSKKAQLEAKIESKALQAKEIQQEITALKYKIEVLDETFREYPGLKEEETQDTFLPTKPGKYSGMGITEAILEVIQANGESPGLFVREILKLLAEEGFNSKGNPKNLYPSAYETCKRLVKRGKMLESEKEGQKAFMRKNGQLFNSTKEVLS